ncbi:MAG: hypothetical protein Ct9H90mV1_0740 [Prasinovirus sp.]|nr:MAG: hypothetical protein Ct9H90mV1_0740 [Prasinovirus sp.]|tara:strand:- start:94 stop:492 length:399 start_codon:yes stop_codon:yes gene_type:complete
MSKRKHENIKRRLSQIRVGLNSNSNSNSNKTVNYPLTTKQQNNLSSRLEKSLDRVNERLNMLKFLHRSIRVNHTGFNKMTPQERMKRYNNAQNTLNKVERQQKIAIDLKKEILSLMRNVKRMTGRNSNSNSN